MAIAAIALNRDSRSAGQNIKGCNYFRAAAAAAAIA